MRNVNVSKKNRKYKADILRIKRGDVVYLEKISKITNKKIEEFYLYIKTFKSGVPVFQFVNDKSRAGVTETFDLVKEYEYEYDDRIQFNIEVLCNVSSADNAMEEVQKIRPEHFIWNGQMEEKLKNIQ